MTRGTDTEITPYRDGALVVRGPIRLVDATGAEIPVRRSTIAPCRCGRSRIKPFCDGTHKAAGFRAFCDGTHKAAGFATDDPGLR